MTDTKILNWLENKFISDETITRNSFNLTFYCNHLNANISAYNTIREIKEIIHAFND